MVDGPQRRWLDYAGSEASFPSRCRFFYVLFFARFINHSNIPLNTGILQVDDPATIGAAGTTEMSCERVVIRGVPVGTVEAIPAAPVTAPWALLLIDMVVATTVAAAAALDVLTTLVVPRAIVSLRA